MKNKSNTLGVFRKIFLSALLAQSFGAVKVQAVENNQTPKLRYSEVGEIKSIKENKLSKPISISESLNKTDKEPSDLTLRVLECHKTVASDQIKGLMGHRMAKTEADQYSVIFALRHCIEPTLSDSNADVTIEVIRENKDRYQEPINEFIRDHHNWCKIERIKNNYDSPKSGLEKIESDAKYDKCAARMNEIAKMAHPNVLNKFINGKTTAKTCLSPELIPSLDLWNKNFTSVFKGRETADFMIHFLPSLIKQLKEREKGRDGNSIQKSKKWIDKSMIGFKDLIHNFLFNQLKQLQLNPTIQDPMARNALDLLFNSTVENQNLLLKLAIHCNRKDLFLLQFAMEIFGKKPPVKTKTIEEKKQKRQLEIEASREWSDTFKKNQKRAHQVEANAGPEFTFPEKTEDNCIENKGADISNQQPAKKRDIKALGKNDFTMYSMGDSMNENSKPSVTPQFSKFQKDSMEADPKSKIFTAPRIDIFTSKK
jgi:hypothetical protein